MVFDEIHENKALGKPSKKKKRKKVWNFPYLSGPQPARQRYGGKFKKFIADS